jgi:hypothetical protein
MIVDFMGWVWEIENTGDLQSRMWSILSQCTNMSRIKKK